MIRVLTLTTALTVAALAAHGQEAATHDGHMAAGDTPAAAAFAQANSTMHAAMTIEPTGDVDVDFIRAMIPHHQGAVEMARILLEYGTDPETRALAEGIIAAQEAEIAWMLEWLAARGY